MLVRPNLLIEAVEHGNLPTDKTIQKRPKITRSTSYQDYNTSYLGKIGGPRPSFVPVRLPLVLRMGDDQKRAGTGKDTVDRAAQILRIECGEALIEDHELGLLKQCAGDVKTAALSVG